MKLIIKKIPWYLSWKGLIGKKPEPILLKTRFGIHTCGMSYSIDVVILDRNNIVRKIKENLLPNRLFFWNPLFDTVLELPAGTISKLKLHIGDGLDTHIGI